MSSIASSEGFEDDDITRRDIRAAALNDLKNGKFKVQGFVPDYIQDEMRAEGWDVQCLTSPFRFNPHTVFTHKSHMPSLPSVEYAKSKMPKPPSKEEMEARKKREEERRAERARKAIQKEYKEGSDTIQTTEDIPQAVRQEMIDLGWKVKSERSFDPRGESYVITTFWFTTTPNENAPPLG